MRLKLTCLLLLLAPALALAQARQQVTNLAGFDLSVPNYIITSSIGEPAIITLASEHMILTQGFLQPELLPCEELNFSYYPNPANREITIEAYGCEKQIVAMELFDTWGRSITHIKPAPDNKVQLGDISPGVYLIRVTLSSQESKAIKIVKVGL